MLKKRTALDAHKDGCVACVCPLCSGAKYKKLNSDRATTSAILNNIEIQKTLFTILNQRSEPEIPYYIYKTGETISKNYNGIKFKGTFSGGWPNDYTDAIGNALTDVGNIIGAKFKKVDDPSKSLFDFGKLAGLSRSYYYAEEKNSQNILGLSAAYGNGDSVWRLMTYSETSRPDIAGRETLTKSQVRSLTSQTIKHEIGHAFGLSHPGKEQNGWNKSFNQSDTLMSYNASNPPNYNYTAADQAALSLIGSDITDPYRARPAISIDKSNPLPYDEVAQSVTTTLSDIRQLHKLEKDSNHDFSGTTSDSRHDLLTGMDSAANISSGPGWDIIKTGKGKDYIHAGKGNDFIKSGKGNDIALGGSGTDFIHGGRGNDKLIGGAGIDLIKAGAGQDVVVISYKNLNSGYDSLVGFTDEDTIRLKGFNNPEKLSIQHLANKSLLHYGCHVIAAIDTTITFDDHVTVV